MPTKVVHRKKITATSAGDLKIVDKLKIVEKSPGWQNAKQAL